MNARGAELFGRDSELAALTAFVRDAAGPAALVLDGEPGIGKTTLWRSAVSEARKTSVRVLASSPASGETQLSFAVLADLLAESVKEVGADLPKPQRRALELALLLDEAADEDVQPRTVLAATLSTLRLLAERQPVLIAIDDLQWVDLASLDALSFAFRRLGDAPVSVLGAQRLDPGGQQDGLLGRALEQRHGPSLRRLNIGPLSLGAIHDAIRERFGVSFVHSVMRQLHEASGGNPFYALELARTLAKRPAPLEPGGTLPVPETLQQIVNQRLDGLSTDAQQLLATVALLSDPTMETLEAAGSGTALDEALRAGVVEQVGGGRVRFSHPLLASAAVARVPPAARRALHIRLAELVVGEERARHLALGAPGPSAEISDELERAVREAVGRGAIGAAAALAEQALRLTPPEQDDALRRRQLETARFEIRHGDTEHARAHLDPMLAELPAGPMRAGVLLQLARMEESNATHALELCEQAIAEAGPADVRGAEANQLAAEMSMLSGNVPAALDHARLACVTAENAGDSALLIESLGTLCHYQTYTGSIEPGLLERAVELERRQKRPSNNYSPREILGLRLMYADRLDEARTLLEASLATSADLGDELDRASLLVHLTQLECRAGRLAIADEHAREMTRIFEQAAWGMAPARFASALVGAHLGRVARVRDEATEGAEVAARGGSEVFRVLNLWALGFLELSVGDSLAADRSLHELPATVDGMGYANPGVRPVHADAIEARIGAGELAVEPMIDDLERRGQAFDNPSVIAAAARCRGLLRAAEGSMDEAIEAMELAVRLGSASPQPLERARSLLVLGSTLRRAKRRREARDILTSALEAFDYLGTPLWAEKAAAELARIPGRTAAPSGLTATEARVAELVAEGLSNKEVASTLFVSVRTVEANLSSVYSKLGVRSRSELTRRLTRDPAPA